MSVMSIAQARPGIVHGTVVGHSAVLRFITAGSVDDGKSTLIGRLLYDLNSVPADQLAAIQHSSRKRGLAAIDLSLLTDGLEAEREQGITIDVAYRYFATAKRKFIIGDAPGHEQYTRNMVTAASTADLAIILVDARKGLVTQTRRHSYLAHLLGIKQVVLAINKMDSVAWQRDVYEQIVAEYAAFAATLGIKHVCPIPLSALHGDNVVVRSAATPWYQGPTLIEHLESAPAQGEDAQAALRFPVQRVARVTLGNGAADVREFRGYQGTVASGELSVGATVKVLPTGRSAQIRRISQAGRDLMRAVPDTAVVVELDEDLDISRGDMLVDGDAPPNAVREMVADLCWLSEAPLNPKGKYLIKHTTRTVRGYFAELRHQLDVNTLQRHGHPTTAACNDIIQVRIKLQQPLFVDAYADNRTTGSFIVIDEATLGTVGAGVIV